MFTCLISASLSGVAWRRLHDTAALLTAPGRAYLDRPGQRSGGGGGTLKTLDSALNAQL